MSSSSLNWVVSIKPNMLKKAELNLLRQSFEYYASKEIQLEKVIFLKESKSFSFQAIFCKD